MFIIERFYCTKKYKKLLFEKYSDTILIIFLIISAFQICMCVRVIAMNVDFFKKCYIKDCYKTVFLILLFIIIIFHLCMISYTVLVIFVVWLELCLIRPMRFKTTGINTQKVNDAFLSNETGTYSNGCKIMFTCITQCGFCLNKCIVLVICIVLCLSNITHMDVVLRSVS